MSAMSSAPPLVHAHAQPQQPTQVNVNLTDTIKWQWYLLAVLVPGIGFIAGIFFMAKSKIGPALALWATCFIAALTWSATYAGIEYTKSQSESNAAISQELKDSTAKTEAYTKCINEATDYAAMDACPTP